MKKAKAKKAAKAAKAVKPKQLGSAAILSRVRASEARTRMLIEILAAKQREHQQAIELLLYPVLPPAPNEPVQAEQEQAAADPPEPGS
jgi:hypothetical protein